MKDSQQMSVDISNQNDMALKALPPVGIKDNIFPIDSVVEDDLLDEDFHLHLSEDDSEEKSENDGASKSDANIPQENEDDILDKFICTDKETVCNGLSEKLEDKLLNDTISDTVKSNDESANSEEIISDKTKSESIQNEEEKKEKANADLLEDQIMDTEHLLQIVDKEQDDAEDTKDSCSSNSETFQDKSEDNETECEKNDNGEEEEESETTKPDDKDENSVEIEESSLYKDDVDAELEKEYENMINEKNDNAEESGNDQPKVTEDSKAESEEIEKETNEIVSEDVEINGLDQDDESSDSAPKTSKRPLTNADSPSDSKKPKYSPTSGNETESTETEDEPAPKSPASKIQALNVISEFMQKKTLKKLTREDLEQICLLKMCEAICHKSEIGELRHQLGVQEQMVDMWRKEAAQLTKQARDLEIVNKRLLHEVRLKNERDKPLIPVKITRSVGLQVRSDNNVITNVIPAQKRRFSRPLATPTAVTTPPTKQNRFSVAKPATPINSNTNNSKSITNKVAVMPANKPAQQPLPKAKAILPKSPSSLLSKALQNSTAQATPGSSNTTNPSHSTVNNSTVTPTSNNTSNAQSSNVHKSLPNQSPKPTKQVESKVIDLTDEDDKKPTPVTTSSPTVTTQGVRIVSAPVKTTNVVSSQGVVNPPRIMYVYNNQIHQGLIADSSKIGTQKLMLKLNSNVIGQTNGVIATVSNGSTLAVTTANIRTTQVQPLRLSTPVTTVRTSPATKSTVLKHPAPLPPPPITQIGIAARKPIPPKPHLSIRRSSGGIVLSWKMPYNLDNYEAIASYQLYAYQETTSPPSSDMWRKVGDVKALALPMACTLTQFADGNKYHFAVRAVDVQKPHSHPKQKTSFFSDESDKKLLCIFGVCDVVSCLRYETNYRFEQNDFDKDIYTASRWRCW
ncbi:hypothetical protein RN001_014468 [Aquatica leii]|uniref:Fibronectin type-III domain-containing protein n=1 Tax=Aquatica leii TaxID=1421715 RepID=A0AAN7NY33_9COLE|nr:hypothetical protein RN001_014468 [Aquatica leii]